MRNLRLPPPWSLALAGLLQATCGDALAGEAELQQRLDALETQIAQLRAEIAASQAAPPPPADPPAAPPNLDNPAPLPVSEAANAPRTVLGSYGEVVYSRGRASVDRQTDVARAVLGIQHRFDDRTRLIGEFEWEHAVTSATDQGEAAVEQLYVERALDAVADWRLRAGLMLMPVGLLNQNHEPTAYYGVHRNLVETAIIPTTWREAGVALAGQLLPELSLDAGITTGFDLSRWDAASGDGLRSPLGSIHQEGQLARSADLSLHGALNWRPQPSLLLGGSLFGGGAGQKVPGFAAPNARVLLWDLHARYQPGRWDWTALYARGSISDTAALNQTLVGNPSLVPARFDGGYLQGAYSLWRGGDVRLSPFLRLERYNTGSAYAALPVGLSPQPRATETVSTLGANLMLGEGVVFKADYRKFRVAPERDSFNLGMGYAF